MAPAPSDGGLLAFLYGTAPGRLLLRPLISRPVSRLAGWFMDSPLSRPLIAPFIRKNGIDMADYEAEEYQSFNAFFTRRIKPAARPMAADPETLMAPCDGRLSVYKIGPDSLFAIKGSAYDVRSLLGNDERAEDFTGGTCLVFRLSVDDYHRYHYLDDGEKDENRFIPGALHTVRPIALAHTAVFVQNCREYTVMKTAHFGAVAQIEVGAMLVGKISNNQQAGAFVRGQEKGKFLYGGSTVVVLLQKDAAQIDQRFWRATDREEETRVKLGEGIGFSRTGGKHA
ncbi:MAG: phosphatidylserine decarboxylase [Clostridia bacterium]|nr:phosphatidylserine decarboxylase [Clostridia bacterium]